MPMPQWKFSQCAHEWKPCSAPVLALVEFADEIEQVTGRGTNVATEFGDFCAEKIGIGAGLARLKRDNSGHDFPSVKILCL